MIRHHPSETTLAAYAGGVMSQALGLAVATHLNACPSCRRLSSAIEAVGGAILDDCPPADMQQDALAHVLARTERPVAAISAPPRAPGLPPPLDACVFGPWMRIGFGLRWRPLIGCGRAMAGLLEAAPNRVLPNHHHTGVELTCVISGSFIDGDQRFTAGDLAEVDADIDHRPFIDGTVPCLCIIATEGVRLSGVLGLAQRLLGG